MKTLGFLLIVMVNFVQCQDLEQMIIFTLQGVLKRLDVIDAEIKAMKTELNTEVEELKAMKTELNKAVEEKITAMKTELNNAVEEKITALKMELNTEVEEIKGVQTELKTEIQVLNKEVEPLRCKSPFNTVRGVGCIHIIEKSQTYERSRESCKKLDGDLFVAINSDHFLRLAQHFIDTNQAAKQKYMWVGVKEGVWLNGRKVVPEEEAPGNPTMGNGTCSYTDGDVSEKFLLWTDPCSSVWWALCEIKY